MTVRIWQLIAALVSVLGVIALPSSVGLARSTTDVSPNCAQRAAYLALVTAMPTGSTCPTVRRASTVLGETARPQRVGPTIEPRPTTARTREGGQPYSYDENGNLTARDTQGLSYDTGNRLRQLGDITFERDRNGQLVRQTSPERDDRYDWDALGQLRCVHHRDGATTRFGYDAFGRRVFKDHQPATTLPAPNPLASFAWATGPLPGEPRGPGGTAPRHLLIGRTEYFWAGDDLLAEARNDSLTEYAMWGFAAEALWENGQLRHVVNSQQGVPQELVDPSGKLIWQGTFDDWGKLIAEKGSTTCRLRLPGQLADDETGLHYNRFRYYSPEAGQFVSADPIGFEGGTNEYRFAPSAINYFDPLGLSCPDNACKRTKQKGKFTEPNLPDKTIVREGGVEIVHYTRSGDHGPAHLHVIGQGPETRIGQAGEPIKGSPAPTAAQRAVIEANKPAIRKAVDQIQRWYRFENVY